MNVLIVGVAGHNIGDDAISYIANEILKKENLDIKVTVINPGRLEKYNITEVFLNRGSFRYMFNLLRQILITDIVLIGGGTIIQDKQGVSFFKGMLPLYFQIILISKIFLKPVFSLPIGVDKLHTTLGKVYFKLIFKLVNKIYFRDEYSSKYSYELLKVPIDPKKYVYYDPAILIPKSNGIALKVKQYSILSLVGESIPYDLLKDLINKFLCLSKKNKCSPYFLVMDSRPHQEISIYEKYEGKLNIINNKDLLETCRIIRRAEFVISMRLHSLILGLGFTKLLCVSRSEKNKYYSKQNNITEIEINDIPEISCELLNDLLENTSINRDSYEKGKESAELYFSNIIKSIKKYE